MPIYPYVCLACGHKFEYLARRINATPEECPSCQSRRLRKEFAAFSVGAAASSSKGCVDGAACPSCRTCASGSCPYSGV